MTSWLRLPLSDYSVARTSAKAPQGKKGVLYGNTPILSEKKPSYAMLENVSTTQITSTQRGRDFVQCCLFAELDTSLNGESLMLQTMECRKGGDVCSLWHMHQELSI